MNFDKLDDLLKKTGKSKAHLCKLVERDRYYIRDCKRSGNVPDEYIKIWADSLGTTYEYLTDQTDDPLPTLEQLADMAESLEERIVQDVMLKLAEIPEDRRETFRKLVTLPDDEFNRAMDMLELLWKK